jgi:hypothetical protein
MKDLVLFLSLLFPVRRLVVYLGDMPTLIMEQDENFAKKLG